MKITNNIFSVGAVDKDVRIFHGYEVPYGTTYNAYLIIDEKITLVDFVKEPFADVLLNNIKEVIGDKKIDYIICNHVEPDHSGAMPKVIERYPDAVIYGTGKCKVGLEAYYPGVNFKFNTVTLGDTLDLGQNKLNFIPMPMVHWPDSMSTFFEADKVLFSNDALGQHIGTGCLWDTDLEDDLLMERVADYYANIVLPFGFPVTNLIKNLGDFDIEIACPSHGVILKDKLGKVLDCYCKWSNQELDENKVVIIYDTMWKTTEKMAQKLAGTWKEKGFAVEVINLSQKHYSYAMTRLLDAKYVFVGSPTLNNEMLPTVIAFLTYMKGLKPKNRVGMAFGSYGWSGESIGNIQTVLESAGFEMLESEKALWNI